MSVVYRSTGIIFTVKRIVHVHREYHGREEIEKNVLHFQRYCITFGPGNRCSSCNVVEYLYRNLELDASFVTIAALVRRSYFAM